MTKKYNIAIIGATGNVGRETLSILAERNFPVNNIYAVASSSSLGVEVSFGDNNLKTTLIENLDFSNIDIAFFAAGSAVSKKYIAEATSKGCVVIDKSSFFRLDKDIPLIVPEANLPSLKNYSLKNIIANPNCCTIPLAVVLKPLDNEAIVKRVVISTYQSVSGSGKDAMDELYNQTKSKYVFNDVKPKIFQKQIAFNLFPYCGEFEASGSTSEESKITNELKKILGNHIQASVTCVRVPVFISHSMSVNIEFKNKITAEEVTEILRELDEIAVVSHLSEMRFVSPVEVVGEDAVYVSRIRDDESTENAINLWISADNLRKGAALNGVQIAEELIKIYM